VAERIVARHDGARRALALLGGLHYLVLAGEAAWDDPLDRHEAFLSDYVARQGVQTNEVQRSWVLLPLFLHAAGSVEPVDVVELGASAGLNLAFDRYDYRYEAGTWGVPDAAVILRGRERRPVPRSLLERPLAVRSRVGIDRAPIDVRREDGARLLESFVWAGQDERMRRLRAAIEAVKDDPPEIVAGDVAEVLPDVLASLPRDGLTIVFQTSLFEYIPPEARASVRATLEGAPGPLVFVASGSPRGVSRAWGMRVHRPGQGYAFVGHADYHGEWLDYDL